MKKKIIIGLTGLILVVAGLIFYITNSIEKPCANCLKSKNSKTEATTSGNIFQNKNDLCKVITLEMMSNLLGKTVTKTNPVTTSTIHSCQYYLNDKEAVIINHDYTNVGIQKQALEYLGWKTEKNPKILMDNFVVIQEDGLINKIYLVVNPDEDVMINRTSAQTISEAEMITLAAKLAEIISGIVQISGSETETVNTVPLPQETDIVQNFFVLIGEKRPTDAVSMMSKSITDNDSEKQAWAVQFNAINSMKVVKIEPVSTNEWTNVQHIYKLTLDVTMKPESANAPIPNFGWSDGENIRWVTMVMENSLWKIKEISTGP
jgi:hypothetical protein